MCVPAEVPDPADDGRGFLGGRVNEASACPNLDTAVVCALACFGSEEDAVGKKSISCCCCRTGRTVLVASLEEAAAAALTCGTDEIPK